jgi:hypothetical protein
METGTGSSCDRRSVVDQLLSRHLGVSPVVVFPSQRLLQIRQRTPPTRLFGQVIKTLDDAARRFFSGGS